MLDYEHEQTDEGDDLKDEEAMDCTTSQPDESEHDEIPGNRTTRGIRQNYKQLHTGENSKEKEENETIKNLKKTHKTTMTKKENELKTMKEKIAKMEKVMKEKSSKYEIETKQIKKNLDEIRTKLTGQIIETEQLRTEKETLKRTTDQLVIQLQKAQEKTK